jgi:hypothetical protein
VKRHIIIEGPDGAGKTTLARQIAFLTGREYHHEGPPPAENVFGHYVDLIVRNRPTVFDRLFEGEGIYGPLLRGSSSLGHGQLSQLRELARVNARTILVAPPRQTCFANWKARKDRGGELIEQEHVFSRTYDAWLELADAFDVTYDYTLFQAKEAA